MTGTLTGEMFSSLSVPDYRRLYFGNMAFQFNSWMGGLTFGWLMLLIGNSPFWLGLSGAMTGLAMTCMSPLGGAFADAWDRRRSLLVTQTTAIVVNAGVATLYVLDVLSIWHLLVASLLMGMSFTFNMPARQSLMAEIVPRPLLPNATALQTASMNLARITGPSMAGFLLSTVGPLFVMLLGLCANTWTVTQILSIRHRSAKPSKAFTLKSIRITDGFRYVYRTRPLLDMMLVVTISNIFGLSYVQMLPSFARDSLHLDAAGLGILTSSMGGGALVGSLIMARVGIGQHHSLMMRGAAFSICLLLLALGWSGSLWLAAPLLALIGSLTALLTALSISTVQQYAPDELSGRVFGVYMVCTGLTNIGSLPLGAIADRIGTDHAIGVWGSIGACLVLAFVGYRTLTEPRAATVAQPADAPTPS
ncbi:MAG: MFS transporter [Chloroflexi bacterium]|nr:MFS transporter [Chloroflexota bacterium]